MAKEFNKKEYYAQRITCPVCYKDYVRSNSSAHLVTKYHNDMLFLVKKSLNDKEKKIIKRIIGFSSEQLRFISESVSDTEEESEEEESEEESEDSDRDTEDEI